jgi:hypothetical protein
VECAVEGEAEVEVRDSKYPKVEEGAVRLAMRIFRKP